MPGRVKRAFYVGEVTCCDFGSKSILYTGHKRICDCFSGFAASKAVLISGEPILNLFQPVKTARNDFFSILKNVLARLIGLKLCSLL